MIKTNKFWFLLVVNYFIHNLNCLNVKNAEYDLYNELFQNYTSSIRPVDNWSDKISVVVNLNLRKVAEVIESHQTVMIYVKLEMKWTDANLKWDPKKNNIDSIVLPAEKLWIPDIHLFNSATDNDRIYPVNVELFANGTVVSYPVNQLYAHCDFSFSDFPYDTQDCDFIIGTTMDKLRVNVNLKAMADANKIIPNAEWKLISFKETPTWIFSIAGIKEMFNIDWSVSKVTLTIKRSPTFFVNLFVWPMIFILFIGSCLFILPPTCVERTSMGTLLLLSIVLISLMLESYTPKNSTNISILGKLVGFTMFMITWSTTFSTFTISLDRENFTNKSLPNWLRNLMIKYIGRLVCKEETLSTVLNSSPINNSEEIQLIPAAQNENNSNAVNEIDSDDLLTKTKADLDQSKKLLVLINNHIAMLRIRLQERDLKEQNKKDWYLIACALDRFFLYLYFIIMFLGLFVIFI